MNSLAIIPPMKRLLIALAAILTFLGVAVAPSITTPIASAYLSTCSVGWYGTNDGHASCATYGAPGGLNQVRVRLTCWQSSGGGTSVLVYGIYVTGINATSNAWCPADHPWAGSVIYQTR